MHSLPPHLCTPGTAQAPCDAASAARRHRLDRSQCCRPAAAPGTAARRAGTRLHCVAVIERDLTGQCNGELTSLPSLKQSSLVAASQEAHAAEPPPGLQHSLPRPRTHKAHGHSDGRGAGVWRNERAVIAIISINVLVAHAERRPVPGGVHHSRQPQAVHAVHQAAAGQKKVYYCDSRRGAACRHGVRAGRQVAAIATSFSKTAHVRRNSSLHGSSHGQPPPHSMPSAFIAGVG